MSEITDAVDALKAKYEAQETVDESAKTLLVGLAQKVQDLSGTIVANSAANSAAKASLTELANKIDTDSTSMAEAVSANTPAEEEPPTP